MNKKSDICLLLNAGRYAKADQLPEGVTGICLYMGFKDNVTLPLGHSKSKEKRGSIYFLLFNKVITMNILCLFCSTMNRSCLCGFLVDVKYSTKN